MTVAMYGGVEFDCLVVSDRFERRIERNEYPGRDGGDARDRGISFRVTDCEIIFFDRPPVAGEGELSRLGFRDRWHRFFAAFARGRAQDFVHPTEGGFRAVVEDLEKTEDPSQPDVIRATCRFVEDSTNPSPLVTGSARPRTSGLADVRVEIDVVGETLAALPSPPALDFLDEIESLVTSWQEPALARDVAAELGQATRILETVQTEAGLATDPDSYEAFVAIERLAARLRLAALTARQSQPQLREVVVPLAQPLRTFVVALYGAAEAFRRYDEVLDLNDIDDPGFVEQGARLIVPVAELETGQALRSANR